MENKEKELEQLLGKTFKGTVITDPVLDPYFVIRYAEGGFAVVKKREDKEGTLKSRIICYPSSFTSCLYRIAQEQLDSGGNHYTTIQGYVDQWKQITTRILEAYKTWNVEKL